MSSRIVFFSVLLFFVLCFSAVTFATEKQENVVVKKNVIEDQVDLEKEKKEVALVAEKQEKVALEETNVEEQALLEGIELENSLGNKEESIEEVDVDVELSEDENKAASGGGFREKYIDGHLEIGTRLAHRMLTNDDSGHKGGWYGSGTFLGTIYALDEKQSYLPVQLYGRYLFNKYFGLEIGYDQLEAKTVTPSSYGTDGNVKLSGLTLSVLGRYANSSSFTPYLGAGIGFFSANFTESSNWKSSYGDRRHREMVVDDVQAVIAFFGVMWEFVDQWNLDISAKYMGNADVDAVFKGYTWGVLDTVQSGYFPMDNWAIQFGISYSF